MYWMSTRSWLNKTVFIIGGGPSLKGFDWAPLHDKHIIGCNDAYLLGNWVDICCFGDVKWYKHHKDGLTSFSGLKVTWRKELVDEPGVSVLQGQPTGLLLKPEKIGWNTSTGAMAINLAVKMGSKKIILLGFDMTLGASGESNWHENCLDKPSRLVFKKFDKGFAHLKAELQEKAPDVEVLNANPDSGLDIFPKAALEDLLYGER